MYLSSSDGTAEEIVAQSLVYLSVLIHCFESSASPDAVDTFWLVITPLYRLRDTPKSFE